MTPADMAALHVAAFVAERPWAASEFQDLLTNPHAAVFAQTGGFALTRTVAGESELLTIAVDPALQRQGIAHALMQAWLHAIETTADTAFLEVAQDNTAARALYARFNFAQTAVRSAYYARKTGPAMDALILRRDLTKG